MVRPLQSCGGGHIFESVEVDEDGRLCAQERPLPAEPNKSIEGGHEGKVLGLTRTLPNRGVFGDHKIELGEAGEALGLVVAGKSRERDREG
jgi:hypothetical protein